MPSTVAANATNGSRFELPALNLNFGSITDGTDIPPPPASPVEKEKPVLPETPKKKADSDTAAKNKEETAVKKPEETPTAAANGNSAGIKRPADAPPSPSASYRAGSIRRMFSRTKLNNSDAESQLSSNGVAPSVNGSRPASRSGNSILDERKSKRASGWFKRLRGGDSKRSSLVLESHESPTSPASTTTTPATNKPSGPPPPMIPELKEFEKDEGSLGNDLFKNIN